MIGDGKTALRGSWGIFYNFPRSTGDGGYPFSGGCPVSCTTPDPLGDVRRHHGGDAANLIENPVNVTVGGYEQPLSKSHNVNVAFQRDIGFNTVAEIAYVGNFTWNHGRIVDVNRLPLYVYGNPTNLVNNAPVNANSLRSQYGNVPRHGLGQRSTCPELYTKTLQYNALQMQVPRRLSNGLQMGLAYTLAKGEGYHRLRPLHRRDRRRSGDQGPLLGPDDRRSPAQPRRELQLRHPDVLRRAGVQAAAQRLADLRRLPRC